MPDQPTDQEFEPSEPTGGLSQRAEALFAQDRDERIRQYIEDFCAGVPVKLDALRCEGLVYVVLRLHGRPLHWNWYKGTFLGEALASVQAAFREKGKAASYDTLEIDLTYDYERVPPGAFSSVFANRHRGIRGIEMRYGDKVRRLAPSEAIARNMSFERFGQVFLETFDLEEAAFHKGGGEIWSFEAKQYLVTLGPPTRARQLLRGNQLRDLQSITPTVISDMVETMSDWMLRQVDAAGRMTYKYWPSRGEESDANNTIRQFMATLCLIRLAEARDDPKAAVLAERNLDYNLVTFFHVHEDYGTIAFDGSAKLGAAALAALSLLECPNSARYQDKRRLLVKGIEALWQSDGAFRTFHFPPERNDNQNFYPGEALLFLAHLYAETKAPSLLARCLKSFDYYRAWHRENPNPAFIPWHTQAYALLFDATGKEELRDFIFEMNDWLITTQQWKDAPTADLQGRFYDPSFKAYGPPHASATGVYLEGLVDAFRLAEACGDQARKGAYETAIWRGLRNLRQLQFLDEVDMFYISKRDRVRGALRTETYHNEVRVDNVQHGLMALLRLQAFPAFKE